MDKNNRKILGKFVRLEQFDKRQNHNENWFDATKPSVLIWLTISYIAIVFFLIIGVPWQGSDPTPIPLEDLPIAIPIFILFYIIIIGGLYLRDKLRK